MLIWQAAILLLQAFTGFKVLGSRFRGSGLIGSEVHRFWVQNFWARKDPGSRFTPVPVSRLRVYSGSNSRFFPGRSKIPSRGSMMIDSAMDQICSWLQVIGCGSDLLT